MAYQKMGATPDEQSKNNGTGIIRQYVEEDICNEENQTGCHDARSC
ncbi:Uncharacterised protein [Klebsiella pneumoniae]|uniref:Uncharacterized protein n=1 Tax=Klebsiella pneumoniae TaxID=573 RepID=A0A4P0XIW6_KLEPN|nr:Uncharacterised protein [Klebsiella michiganensis]SLS76370.1 Uncharacterised protein [Klebsiella pneumoniae]VAL57543.1 Uncharacterised protein [Enterobacter hormaechei]STW32696.1 Uncharacterised protein [Klebsiella pneumoniae]VGD39324.1 Uncharacterised protein [Klebsiella pneumoniae]